MPTQTICVIHGPNLHSLGTREPEIYGSMRLQELDQQLHNDAAQLGLVVNCHQSNSEGQIIDWLHQFSSQVDGFILNAAAYTHTSVAIRDTISAIKHTVIEVHLSNIHGREDFRHHSMIAPVCQGQISGFGIHSYRLALRYFALLNS